MRKDLKISDFFAFFAMRKMRNDPKISDFFAYFALRKMRNDPKIGDFFAFFALRKMRNGPKIGDFFAFFALRNDANGKAEWQKQGFFRSLTPPRYMSKSRVISPIFPVCAQNLKIVTACIEKIEKTGIFWPFFGPFWHFFQILVGLELLYPKNNFLWRYAQKLRN